MQSEFRKPNACDQLAGRVVMMRHGGFYPAIHHRDDGGVASSAMRRVSMSHLCNAAFHSRFHVSRFSECSSLPGF